MALDTPVNSQITDAVTQTNVKVMAEAPAMAMGAIYQSLAHSTGIMFENAAAAQQQQAILAQAATTQGVMQIYSFDTAAAAATVAKVGQSDVPDNMLSLLAALRAFGSGDAQAQAIDAALAAIKTLSAAPAQPAAPKPAPARPTSAKPKA
ncbi:RebB family R body protein [Caulobacter soli]|uniref:RebB family R body protein n=1 Tax=Caulobacter soli TaxID=2708539 RepID=UPI0013EA8009|nr:RebB family R body protein [Caulobacter soli]